ncbi:hypothetical protein F2Q70_00036913 [Brassica cretica]|uniref:Uncharacterized protein n=1 Tax=Brassica cretica TaxID=69181 RepID=A0A8S9JSS0_BRACR|nr:hypothetical protein F2Q70_00036913 [Brassica cretica]
MTDIDIGTAAERNDDGGGRREPLINREKKFKRSVSNVHDELHSFRKYLRWMCVDQSSPWTAVLSWSMFVVFTLVVPAMSHFMLACANCDSHHSRPYDSGVQLSLSSFAALSFLCLSRFVSKFGLRRFLFFDKLWDESSTVRRGYTNQLNRSLKILFYFVAPCFLAMSSYKIWWYASGASQIPFLGNVILSDTVACLMELCSWLYRTTVIFLVCVLFRLICHLQILRLQDFAQVFQMDSDVGSILSEHLRIRRHLRIISHRYRIFILSSLILVTGSQLYSLLITTKSHAGLNVNSAGELAVSFISLFFFCFLLDLNVEIGDTDDSEDYGEEEDDFDNNDLIPAYAYSTISFQKRQALVHYFENNKAGITVFGFTLDRSTLHTIFGIEMSLVLWLLGKTIGIS